MSLPASIRVETERLLLRNVSEADLPDLLLLNTDDETTRYLVKEGQAYDTRFYGLLREEWTVA